MASTILGYFNPSRDRGELLVIGLCIFQQLSKETDLLISEDVALLASAFQHQVQLDKLDKLSRFKWSSISKSILGAIFVALLALILSIGTFGFLPLSIFVILILLILVIWIFYKKYTAKAFKAQFMCLIEQTIGEKEPSKKLKELIDDNWSFSNSEDYNKRLKTLKNGFRDVGLRCLLDFRRFTLTLKSKLPLKADIDNNLISGLPDDLYESYQQEDLDAKALKSLRQLIRLQISEFFKRFLLLFIQNYYQDPDLFRIDLIFRTGNSIIKLMVNNSKERCSELWSLISFHKSLYEPKPLPARILKQENECSTLWAAFRNVRKTLFRSISIIEESESLLQNHTKLEPDCQSSLSAILETLSEELSNARQNVLDIEKTLQQKMIRFTATSDPNLDQEDPRQADDIDDHHSALFQEDEPPKDEVFEAFVPETIEPPKIETDNNSDKHLDLEIRDAESNIYWELKSALKSKAIEHRLREAKAQGIQVNRDQIEHDYNQSAFEKREPGCQPKRNAYLPVERDKLSVEFNFNLALQDAATQVKVGGLNIEETFGESEDDD